MITTGQCYCGGLKYPPNDFVTYPSSDMHPGAGVRAEKARVGAIFIAPEDQQIRLARACQGRRDEGSVQVCAHVACAHWRSWRPVGSVQAPGEQ